MNDNLNLRQLARWLAVQNLFKSLIDAANREQASILFDGSLIESSQILMNELGIYVIDGNSSYIQYEADPEMAHGLEETVGETERRVREQFVLVKKISF